MSEAYLGMLLCGFLGGSEVEARIDYPNLDANTFIRVDCLTPDFAFEFGLDKISSRDSVHQAVLASELTNTAPFVVIFDTDGVEGKLEQEMRQVTEILGIRYARCSENFIQRWAATAGFRAAAGDQDVNDLPDRASFNVTCPLADEMELD